MGVGVFKSASGSGSGSAAVGASAWTTAAKSPSSSGTFADSLRPSPAISTTVTPSGPATARTHTRRRWMNSDPARPRIAVIAPPSAHPLPGCWVTWKPAHSLTPSKVIVPAPFGSVMDSPILRFSRTCAPSESLNPFSFDLSSW